MTEEVRLHLERADDCIKDAEVLLDAHRLAAAAGRAYYAMFHAATALLLDKGVQRTSHSAIISAFGQFIVKKNLVEAKLHQFFREAFDLRQQSDYEPVIDITYPQVQETIKRAKEFVETCRKISSK